VKNLTSQIEVMEANVVKLGDSLAEIEAKISEAQAQKDELIARARTAQTTSKVNDMLNNVGTSSGLAAFEKMREKVEALEAQSEVSAKMALKGSSPSIESKFRELEASTSIDEQLKMMKQQLPQAGGNSSGAAYSSSVNDEIERMKRDQGM
jgi:phage shock protein A